MKGVVETFNADGEPESFRAFGSRLDEFLEKFPVQDGYRVVVEATDILSQMPGLCSLYKAAIESGKNPVELGLPEISTYANQIIFQAQLLDKEGQVVSSSSTYGSVQSPDKTWETLETNARSRVMASVGIGYELLEADEQQHQELMKKDSESSPTYSPPAAAQPAPAELAEQPAKQEAPVEPEPAKAEEPPAEKPNRKTNPAPVTKVKPDGEFPFAADATEEIQEAVLRQIKTLGLNKGIQPQPVTTNQEARAERKRLMTA